MTFSFQNELKKLLNTIFHSHLGYLYCEHTLFVNSAIALVQWSMQLYIQFNPQDVLVWQHRRFDSDEWNLSELVNTIRKEHIIFIKPYSGQTRRTKFSLIYCLDYLRISVYFRFLVLYKRPERFELLGSFDYFNESYLKKLIYDILGYEVHYCFYLTM